MHCESRPELNQNSAEQLGGVRREYSNEKMSRTQAEAARAQRSLSAPPVRIGAVLSQSDQVRCSSVGPTFSENKFCLRKTFRARSGEAPRVRVDSDARGKNWDSKTGGVYLQQTPPNKLPYFFPSRTTLVTRGGLAAPRPAKSVCFSNLEEPTPGREVRCAEAAPHL
jgi:hypothetical protein